MVIQMPKNFPFPMKISGGALLEENGQIIFPVKLGRVVSSEDELKSSVFGNASEIKDQKNSWL